MFTLSGRTCVFAGATGGDGVTPTKELLKAGMNVVTVTHNPVQAQKLADEVAKENYPGKMGIYMDGKCYDPPKTDAQVFEEIYNEFGSIDVIISNIGGPDHKGTIDDVSVEDLTNDVVHLVSGAYGMLKNALPYLRKSKAPRVIFMTAAESVKGGNKCGLSNSVAKGAVYSLMKNCAARLACEGITVNCICKGAVLRIGEPRSEDMDMNSLLPYIPMGRVGTPDDIAQAVCYLASEETSYVTGTAIEVTGGLGF